MLQLGKTYKSATIHFSASQFEDPLAFFLTTDTAYN